MPSPLVTRTSLRSDAIVMMQPAQDGERHDGSRPWARILSHLASVRDRLAYLLMRAHEIEGGTVLLQDAMHLTLVQDEEVIETLTTDTPEEPRSQLAVARGAWTGVRSSAIWLVAATRANWTPSFLSVSRKKERGLSPHGVASRRCCAIQASVGWRVTPAWTTRREPRSMMKNATSCRKHPSMIGRQSHAQISCA
jgi:hypothetical protein